MDHRVLGTYKRLEDTLFLVQSYDELVAGTFAQLSTSTAQLTIPRGVVVFALKAGLKDAMTPYFINIGLYCKRE